jgi:hypothetical protein
MLRDWNAKYGNYGEDEQSWRYGHLSNFTRDAQDALTRLLNPGWRMWGPLGQERLSSRPLCQIFGPKGN